MHDPNHHPPKMIKANSKAGSIYSGQSANLQKINHNGLDSDSHHFAILCPIC